MTTLADYQRFIHLGRYARYLEDKKRRETWEETVKRYCDFWKEKFPELFPYEEIYQAIYNMDVMPSMRALMTAGPALDRDNVAGYNCSYVDVDSVRSFDEIMYILMCGTGVGYSVEREYVQKLPEVPEELRKTDTTIIVGDSKIGWATALRELLSLLYAGKIPAWDLSKIRPAGARLKTFGGRASGPEPLNELFQFAVELFKGAVGRKLSTLEASDLVCKIADAVIVGGVRRSALICLSNLTDERLRTAKSGNWWDNFGWRANANISVAYTEMPDMAIFMREWYALYESKSGERGIFNRFGARARARTGGRRDPSFEFGTNPCGEIVLRPKQFCNLSEVVVRASDGEGDIERKVKIAAVIGTFQSTLSNFRYLRPIWKKNVEEERLLGVSLTGIMDNQLMINPDPAFLQHLKSVAIITNAGFSKLLGINPSTAVTTIKPSGTVSQLVDSSSGIHPRYSPFYIRTVRADVKDPLAQFMKAKGYPCEPDVTKPDNMLVFSFPIKSPESSVCRNDLTAIQQLEHYLLYAKHWCEHNPSITVYVREQEWMEVGAWVYKNLRDIGGVSFLPHSEHIYKQAPYTEVSLESYNEMLSRMPKGVDFSELVEEQDTTIGMQEYACVSGVCEI